jgi:hypothetical protein
MSGRSAMMVAVVLGASAVVSACGATGFCASHRCIANFDNGHGSIVRCADGEWAHSGGESGACSGHGGESGTGWSEPGFGSGGNATAQKPSAPGTDFCASHTCIPSFYEGRGSIVQCQDGEWSHSGGEPGACSGHGGEIYVAASVHTPTPSSSRRSPHRASAPSPAPAAPRSHPVLIGSRSGSSHDYRFTVQSIAADHTLDLARSGTSPPQFGISFRIRCYEPNTYDISTWRLSAGRSFAGPGFGSCLGGSLGLVLVVATGCGPHALKVKVQGIRANGSNKLLAGPMLIPFRTC